MPLIKPHSCLLLLLLLLLSSLCVINVQVGKGMLRVLRCRKDGIADMVPVDLLNNVIISAGWLTGVAKPTKPMIYQYTSGSRNPIKWIELCMCGVCNVCVCIVGRCVMYMCVVCLFLLVYSIIRLLGHASSLFQ